MAFLEIGHGAQVYHQGVVTVDENGGFRRAQDRKTTGQAAQFVDDDRDRQPGQEQREHRLAGEEGGEVVQIHDDDGWDEGNGKLSHTAPMRAEPPAFMSALAGMRLVSLRPVGEHAPLRRAAARYAIKVLALSPWTLVQRDDAATRDALAAALRADVVVMTSPAAVTAACRLQRLRPLPGQRWVAVGAGTAQRLRGAGVEKVIMPERMDSEGLLALPELHALHGKQVGLVTAPGGRGLIAPSLQQRGARVVRADVYERVTVRPTPTALARLAEPGPLWLALSSQGALAEVLASLPETARQRLLTARVVAASERLARLALERGFPVPVIARDARPGSLLRALVDAVTVAGATLPRN